VLPEIEGSCRRKWQFKSLEANFGFNQKESLWRLKPIGGGFDVCIAPWQKSELNLNFPCFVSTSPHYLKQQVQTISNVVYTT
jgi:hypothetical protein